MQDLISLQQHQITLKEQQNEIMKMFALQQQRSTLPQPQVPTFDGKPIEYQTFIHAFVSHIESKTMDSDERLHYLEQYTSGEVKELVRSCYYMNPDEGCLEARRLLEKKYGNRYKIATAYVEKALSWPEIKNNDSSALNKFSVFLVSCKNAMKGNAYMINFDHPDNMHRLVQKLPYGMRDRWRRTADEIMEVHSEVVKFTDLVKFVEKEARIANNPVFGQIAEPRSSYQSRASTTSKIDGGKQTQRTKSMVTQVVPITVKQRQNASTATFKNSSNKSCKFCDGTNHTLEFCNALRRKPYKERIAFLMQKRLCFGCLSDDHAVKNCDHKCTCKIDGCEKRHPTVLHSNPQQSFKDKKAESGTDDKATSFKHEQQASKCNPTENYPAGQQSDLTLPVRNGFADAEKSCHISGPRTSIGLAIIPVKVRVKGTTDCIVTYAFLDNGSTSSFCTESLMKQLNIPGLKTRISLTTLEKRDTVTDTFLINDLEVSDLDENYYITLPKLYTRPNIPVTKADIPTQEDVDRWTYLQGHIQLPSSKPQVEIGLLIANDVPEVLDPQEVIHSQNGGPYATKTKLGWVVNGPLKHSQSSKIANFYIKTDIHLNQVVMDFFNQEFNDSTVDDKPEMSIEERRFVSSVENSVKLTDDGHYQIGLPFKNPDAKLPNNKPQAEQRAKWLRRKLVKNPKLLSDYKTFMKDLLSKGYARKVPPHMLNAYDGNVWYIPHHGVYHQHKPGKVRVVFDCSAKYQGTSLNDQLLKGPDLTNSLVGVLARFRQEPHALMADIEAMFHQAKVPESNSNVLRFLWWTEGDLERELEEYQMVVHLFGAVSSPSCANFALRKTALDNQEFYDETVISTVLKNFYVDDCLKSLASTDEAITHAASLQHLLRKGGFRLTKWISNDRKVLDTIPEAERNKNVKNLDLSVSDLPRERALGVQWNIEQDQFGFQINKKDRPITRRGILSIVSSVYDPLGFAAPFTLPAKFILQDLCRLKLGWDEDIPSNHQSRWKEWLTDLQMLSQLKIDRCYKPPDFGTVGDAQLHQFSDASELGYGSVSYLRVVNQQGKIHCSFLIGKSRLAPLKQITVPRLELTAATVSVRLNKMMINELEIPIDDSVYWTDSTSVLRYIKNETKRFRTFVANRISKIRNSSEPSQWRYVDSATNPADYASRGLSGDKFLKCQTWLTGPKFLWQEESQWPKSPSSLDKLEENDAEVKKEIVTCAAASTERPSNATMEIFEKFSTWFHLKKIIAWILRYFTNLSRKSKQPSRGENLQQQTKRKSEILPITVDEIKNAEKKVLKQVQTISFPEELSILKKKELHGSTANQCKRKNEVKKSSPLYKLDPVLIDGLLCVGGRLQRARIPQQSRHQVILPKSGHVTDLIIQESHYMSGHSGRQYVLSLLRKRYWIVKANSTVRRVLRSCYDCRRRQALPLQQKMADLPAARLASDAPPFTAVGIDYFGPFYVHRGRSLVKRYGVVFTCLAIRAIHIEVAHNLDTDSFLLALRRFVARRGQVKEIYSDNGTNFTSGEKELRKCIAEWNQEKIHNDLLQKNIQWTFSPPYGSHHGGVWERCIRTIRKILNALLQEQKLNDESLSTLMCEVESIINGRPITTSSDDPNDLEPLTPSHLLLLKSELLLPPGLFSKEDNYSRARWKQVQYMADIFWRRWTREYLPQLQERQKWYKSHRNLEKDDVVLIVDDNAPRNKWLLGRVLETIADKKGFVRRVKLKTKSGTLERPISKMCLLVGQNKDHD